jgi:hypothetical protein
MPALGELVRLLFGDSPDGASHRLTAGEGDLTGPVNSPHRSGAGDALASGQAGVVVGEEGHRATSTA